MEAMTSVAIDNAHDGLFLSAAFQLAVQRCRQLVAFRSCKKKSPTPIIIGSLFLRFNQVLSAFPISRVPCMRTSSWIPTKIPIEFISSDFEFRR